MAELARLLKRALATDAPEALVVEVAALRARLRGLTALRARGRLL
jgi:hypothetical protein